MKRPLLSLAAFSVLELLVTTAIVASLAGLLLPAGSRLLGAADTAGCAANLRGLGTILQTAAIDNDNRFPRIENDPANPIHSPSDGAVTLGELVESANESPNLLRCPADSRLAGSQTGKAASYFQTKGSSYEWLPFFEDAKTSNPTIYAPFGSFTVPLSRVRLLVDYAENSNGPHDRSSTGSAVNVLYADGAVRKVELSRAQ